MAAQRGPGSPFFEDFMRDMFTPTGELFLIPVIIQVDPGPITNAVEHH